MDLGVPGDPDSPKYFVCLMTKKEGKKLLEEIREQLITQTMALLSEKKLLNADLLNTFKDHVFKGKNIATVYTLLSVIRFGLYCSYLWAAASSADLRFC